MPSPASREPGSGDSSENLLSIFDDHFRQPRNTGVIGDADGKLEVENPVCGDVLNLYWKGSAEKGIDQIRFQVYGCPAAIAAGSVLTEMLLNSEMATLATLKAEDIAVALGGLGEQHFHAAVLASDALKKLLLELKRS